MTVSIPVSKQWTQEVFNFAYLCLKDNQLIEPLILGVLDVLPTGESLSPREKRFLFWEELEKRLMLGLPEKQKPTLGQLELFETNVYRQDLYRKHSIQRKKSNAFLYSKLDRDSKGTSGVRKEENLPFEWVLEFLSYQTNRCEIPKNQSVVIAKYLLGELSDSQAIEVEKEFRFNSDLQKSKIRLEKILKELEIAFQALDPSFFKAELLISKKTENSLLNWFDEEQELGKRNEGDNDVQVSADSHSKSEPQSLSQVKIFLLVGAFTCVVGYFGWLEKNTEPLKTAQVVEVIPSVDSPKSTQLSPVPFPNLPSILAEEAANELLGDRTIQLIQEMENKMKTDPLPELNTSIRSDFDKP